MNERLIEDGLFERLIEIRYGLIERLIERLGLIEIEDGLIERLRWID